MTEPTVILELPYPPSVNHYYVKTPRGMALGAKGKLYRQEVFVRSVSVRNRFKLADKLHMEVYIYPPDKRRRDIDNLTKCTLDALQIAGVIPDDSQIDRLYLERMPPIKGGKLEVHIYAL